MRECPKCNYLDPPYWRARIFDVEIDICNISDVDHFDPILASQLRGMGPLKEVCDDIYAYRMTKTGIVWRMWLPLRKLRGWSTRQGYWDGKHSLRAATGNYKKKVDQHSRQKGALLAFLQSAVPES